MPPLSSLSLGHPPPGQPPADQTYSPAQPPPGPFYQPNPVQARQQPLHSPAEAGIQSWVESVGPPQPTPMQPAQQMWAPEMGIKFSQPPGPGGGQGAGGGNKPPGTWNPGSGIRFG